MVTTIRGYKFIKSDMKSANGNCIWKLGEWKKHKGEISLCRSGYHASLTPFQVCEYIYGDRLFIVEARGKILQEENDKFVAEEMRLIQELPTKEIFVEYAIKCAWRNVKHFEKQFPKDKRVRNAVLAAKRWLKSPTEENRSAAESAAWSATSAAWSATSAARSAASAARSAASAARSAAWSATSAARSAAWSATSAAWSATSAARSATSAARSATSAEKEWQAKTLQAIVNKYTKKKTVKVCN